MSSIFSESDTIAFGGVKKSVKIAPKRPPATTQSPIPVAPRSSKTTESRPHTPVNTRDKSTKSDLTLQMQPTQSADALAELIASMKPSYLPREETTGMLRQVIISPKRVRDPMMLVTRDDTTLLIGTGFSTLEKCGKTYTTFPDMRLPFSEKSKLRAWILLDESIDVTLFLTILPVLDFPPIYTTRNLIAKFRDSIKDTSFLEKCRFFEIFSDVHATRNIGGIECGMIRSEQSTCFAIRSGKRIIAYRDIEMIGATLLSGDTTFIESGSDGYQYDKNPLQSGEILLMDGGSVRLHTMHYSFDTFYLDGESIGVEAGFTLADRGQLAEAGVLIFTLAEDARMRTIAGHIFIDSRGFVHSYELMRVHKEILKAIRLNYEAIVAKNSTIERGELAQSLRKEITKYCFVLTGRIPVVMPVIYTV